MSNNLPKSVDFLTQLNIKQLKNIKDLSMSFDENKRLVAIFGENGCGKSTVLYALACVFQNIKIKKIEKGKEFITHTIGEDYRFTDFFPPTSLGQWNDSELELTYTENHQTKSKTYKKGKRWTRYEDRPYREVYFLGINICVPQIELETKTSQIKIEQDKDSELKSRVIKDISTVMNRVYEKISFTNNKKYKLAELSNVSYPSIFMGAGESKIIEILRVLHSAGNNSLILIDELDLTLHTFALKKLLKIMTKISEEKNLQIIFTTHREDILSFDEVKGKIDIKYITNRLSEKTECLNNITSDGYLELTGSDMVENFVYVEDNVSKTIVKEFLLKNNISHNTRVLTYGAIDNAFTIACGLHLSNTEEFDKYIFVLDGDKYQSDDEKMTQIKRRISGTEIDIDEKRQKILEKIIQFNSLNSCSPERVIFDTITQLDNCSEKNILNRQNRHNTFGDNHYLLLQDSQEISKIVSKFSEQPIWDSYTSELREKLLD